MKNMKKLLALLLCAALALTLMAAAVFAEGDGEPEETAEAAGETESAEPEKTAGPGETKEASAPEDGMLVCAAGETLHAAEGLVLCEEGGMVYNGGATVYNDGGTVFNNFGTVFNNAGTTYNNSGTVYVNGGTVFNNAGTAYRNGGEMISNVGAPPEADDTPLEADDTPLEADDMPLEADDAPLEADDTPAENGPRYLRFAEEYSLFADYEGLSADDEGRLFLEDGAALRIRPMEGFEITEAESSSGSFAAQEDGSWLLSGVTESCAVTLAVRLAAPTAAPAGGVLVPGKEITLKAQPVALIRYTLDGSEPDGESEKYEGPITLEGSAVLKARAFLEGVESSGTLEAAYTIPKITPPEFEPVRAGYGKEGIASAAVRVENDGTEDITVKSVLLDGKNAASFTLSTQRGAVIAAGETDGETWTVTPKSYLRAGSYATTMIFTLEGGGRICVPISFTVEPKAAE